MKLCITFKAYASAWVMMNFKTNFLPKNFWLYTNKNENKITKKFHSPHQNPRSPFPLHVRSSQKSPFNSTRIRSVWFWFACWKAERRSSPSQWSPLSSPNPVAYSSYVEFQKWGERPVRLNNLILCEFNQNLQFQKISKFLFGFNFGKLSISLKKFYFKDSNTIPKCNILLKGNR